VLLVKAASDGMHAGCAQPVRGRLLYCLNVAFKANATLLGEPGLALPEPCINLFDGFEMKAKKGGRAK
jgi:hypothetical protein